MVQALLDAGADVRAQDIVSIEGWVRVCVRYDGNISVVCKNAS